MIEPMNLAILIASGLLVISIFTSLISFRIGAPLLLIFLAVGLGAGEDGPGGIDFDNAPAAYFIGSIALAIILFDSGFDTRFQSFRIAAWPAVTLATIGVLLTTVIVGVAARFLLWIPWPEALLMGAIISSTDAAAVFFLLRVGGITIRDRVRSTLEVESSSNDPAAIFLTITLVEFITGDPSLDNPTIGLALALLQQMGLGAILGLAGGFLIAQTVNRIDLEQGLYPLLVLSLAICLFAATGMLGGSGFLAVYVAGVIAGNAKLRGTERLRRFQSGMTWLSQITMFLTLGLLATPSEFPAIVLPAILLALVLTFIGRPLAVWLCLLPFGFSRNETTFVAWVGLRGAVSILLGIVPILGGLPNGQMLFNVAFIVVLASLLIQGWTIRPMARWLGLVVPPRIGPVDRVELELPGRAHHELVVYRINPDSPVAKGERIPRWARPSLIVRDGRSMRVHAAGRLQPGDDVYIFTPPQQVRLLDKLFASPATVDQMDRQFYGDFSLAPNAKLTDVAESYGFTVDPGDRGLTVADILGREFRGGVEVGDRITYGPVEFIVRSVDPAGQITELGLALEMTRAGQPRLPLFQSRKELMALLRSWRDRRRHRRASRSKTEDAASEDASGSIEDGHARSGSGAE
jgi:cell volume regulation protein A